MMDVVLSCVRNNLSRPCRSIAIEYSSRGLQVQDPLEVEHLHKSRPSVKVSRVSYKGTVGPPMTSGISVFAATLAQKVALIVAGAFWPRFFSSQY